MQCIELQTFIKDTLKLSLGLKLFQQGLILSFKVRQTMSVVCSIFPKFLLSE